MISPYQQNIDIIKGFFKKPIVLVLAISSFVCVVYELVVSFFNVFGNLGNQAVKYFLDKLPDDANVASSIIGVNGSGGSGGSLNITAILFAVSFLLFYILSKKQENKLGAPSVMFKVISIITVVCFGIITAFVLLITALLGVITPIINEAFDGIGQIFVPLYIFLAVFMILYLLYSIAQMVFALSIRKSLTSIYLKGTGAVLYGIMSFVIAAIGIVSSVMAVLGLSKIDFITLNGTQTAVMIISAVMSAANSVITGIMAVQYSKYIKNISQRFRIDIPSDTPVNEPSAQQFPQETPVQQAPVQNIPVQPAPIAQNFNPQPIQEQNPFEPIPVQSQPEPIQPPQAPIYEQNPTPEQSIYPQPASQPLPQEQQIPAPQPIQQAPAPQANPDLITPRFCTQCGKPVGADDYFCNNCGTKIIRN